MASSAPAFSDAPSRPSRGRRLARAVAWGLGAALLISVAAWRAAALARERALADLREVDAETMTLVVSNLRMELEKLEFIPQLVARDARIQRLFADPENPLRVQAANRYLEEVNGTVGASDTYVMDITGRTLAASNSSSELSFVGQSFGFRPYFQDALEGISGRYFARGATSHRRGYYFACPIRSNEEIVGVAAVKVRLEGIERTWEELPGRIVLTDWHGIVFATNEIGWRYRALRGLDQRTLEAVVQSRRYSGILLDPRPLVEIEPIDGSTSLMTLVSEHGRPARLPGARTVYLALAEDLPEYGWVVYTMSTLRPVGDWGRAAAALGALGAGLLSLGLFIVAQRHQYRRQRARFEQRERRMLQRNQQELERRIAERTEDLTRANLELQREITQHEQADRELRATQQGLVQAAKLAALGQLAAGVTHELNQPLTALASYADNTRLLIERDRLDEARRNLERITRLTDRMARMTRHLKTFSRETEPGQRQVLEVARAMEAALSLVDVGRSPDRVVLDHRPPDKPLLAVGDPIRLEQVFVNLIKNALDALDALEGGRRRELRIRYRADERRIEVEVRDTGAGIPAEHLGRVFDPFFTTKEAGAGLGLGLSISLGILDEMDGRLRARNHDDGGAVFTVELPRAEPAAEARSA